jgi:hypothetical protein
MQAQPLKETKKEKELASTVADIKAEIKENVEHLAENIRHRAEKIATSAGSHASDYYDTANTWMRKNYGKTILAVGVLAVTGIAAYMFMKKRRDKFDIDL